jgi:hypothetical protein
MSPFHVLVLILVAVAAALPAPALAGTFHVYGLGLNSAGCPNGWQGQTFSPDRFRQRDLCSRWEIQSVRDGTPLRYGDFAGASMFTGEGAHFTGFSIRAFGAARNGVTWNMAMCKSAYMDCAQHWPRSGEFSDYETALGSAQSGGGPIRSRHLFAGVTCLASTCADSSEAGRAVQITHTESHAIVEDYTPPDAPSLTGVATGWNSGQQRLSYTASDPSSGIESVTLTIDGSLHRTNVHSCTRLPAGGYQQPIPCVTSTGGEFALNEPGQLADGRHALTVTARDAGGETGSATQDFWVDNHAPAHPVGLAVAGGEDWRATNDFSLSWERPDQGNGSPIAAAYYKIGSPPATPTDGARVAPDGTIAGLRVPGDGDWPVYVWLEDEAGNANPGHVATAQLRLDTTAPSLAFANERDTHNPAEVRVATADAHSGVAAGEISIRRRGIAEWLVLETRREGTDLVAAVPDDRLERGTYELRASARDGVGNAHTTGLRADGREMVLDLPLRGATAVTAGLSPRARGARGTRPGIRVRYRRSVWLRGALRSGATRLPDTRLAVYTRPLAGGDWLPLGEVVTDGSGRYATRLPKTSSRQVMVRFPGSRLLRPAEDVARLRVRGWAALRLRPSRLRRGGTIAFRGRVGTFDAPLPNGGKLIQIQYLDGRRWRPAVKLGRTDPRGRFAIRYRFRRISRPTRIWFRILVPAEGGWPYATGWSRTRIAYVRP